MVTGVPPASGYSVPFASSQVAHSVVSAIARCGLSWPESSVQNQMTSPRGFQVASQHRVTGAAGAAMSSSVHIVRMPAPRSGP